MLTELTRYDRVVGRTRFRSRCPWIITRIWEKTLTHDSLRNREKTVHYLSLQIIGTKRVRDRYYYRQAISCRREIRTYFYFTSYYIKCKLVPQHY